MLTLLCLVEETCTRPAPISGHAQSKKTWVRPSACVQRWFRTLPAGMLAMTILVATFAHKKSAPEGAHYINQLTERIELLTSAFLDLVM